MELRTLKNNVGTHIGFNKYVYQTLSSAIKQGMFSVQFFLGNPYQINRAKIEEKDYRLSKKICDRFPINIYTHFPYVANLCGKSSKNNLAWSGNSQVDGYLRIVIQQLEYELNCVAKLGGKGVVIHPGSYPDRKEGLDAIIKTINKIKFGESTKLLLENCAGEGNKLCKNFEEIFTILNSIDSIENVGVCVDTAHVWGAGIYNLSKIDEINKMFKEFDEIIGLDKLELIHLNDSSVAFGSKKDRHAEIGTGYIWSENMDSFNHLVNVANSRNIPLILESDGTDIILFTDVCLPCNKNYSCC